MTELQQWIEILAPEFNRYLDLAAFLLGYMTLMQTKIDLIITGLDLRTTTVTEDVHGLLGSMGLKSFSIMETVYALLERMAGW